MFLCFLCFVNCYYQNALWPLLLMNMFFELILLQFLDLQLHIPFSSGARSAFIQQYWVALTGKACSSCWDCRLDIGGSALQELLFSVKSYTNDSSGRGPAPSGAECKANLHWVPSRSRVSRGRGCCKMLRQHRGPLVVSCGGVGSPPGLRAPVMVRFPTSCPCCGVGFLPSSCRFCSGCSLSLLPLDWKILSYHSCCVSPRPKIWM